MIKSKLDLTGKIFGYLTVLKRSKIKYHWICRCKCENICKISCYDLLSKHTRSCGCLQKEKASKNGKNSKSWVQKHGLYKHPLYTVYMSMMHRCYNKNNKYYNDYGGRGIRVCKEWKNKNDYIRLKNFIKWNASLSKEKQFKEGLELDRENNNKGYSPDNCRWVTRSVNMSNRRNTKKILIDGVLSTLQEASIKFKVPVGTIFHRISKGYSPEDAVFNGLGRSPAVRAIHSKANTTNYFVINGEKLSAIETSNKFGVEYATLLSRRRRGLTDDQCIK